MIARLKSSMQASLLVLVLSAVLTPQMVFAGDKLCSTSGTKSGDGKANDANPAAESKVAVSEAERRPVLWKATRGKANVYVYATINHGKDRYFALTGEAARAFKQSKAMAVDSHAGLPSDPYSMGCYASGDKLSSHIQDKTLEVLSELARATDDNIAIYEVWKPFFLITSFDQSLIRQIGFNLLDLERQLITESKRTRKPLMELDPALARLEYFDALTPDMQDQCLRLSLLELLNFEQQETDIEKAWRLGDGSKMADACLMTLKAHPELFEAYQALYKNRNKQLVSVLANVAKNLSPIFLSLDVRRVVGEKGVLSVLMDEGFTIEQCAGGANAVEPGVVAELPYVDSDDGSQSEEISPYMRASEHYRAHRYKQALDLLSENRADERCRYLSGLCYLGLDQVTLAAGEFRWVAQNARDPKIREIAETALHNLR
ncbi:TraB/GumN family protein [Candidatus Obscuribacterales bacterium]|nr:TraB/GumN family protein [Candidatus Obscuribacterales bacterium]